MTKISPANAILFEAISTVALCIFSISYFMAPIIDRDDVFLVGGILVILFSVPGIIASMIVHYRCWKTVPKETARTTPGKAVGFLFIPYFNFYWYFVSYAGLAEDFVKSGATCINHRGLGIAVGILSITMSMCFSEALFEVLLLAPLGIAYFIVWLLYTLRMVSIANSLLGDAVVEVRERD